jgi:hypothetical protein
LARHGHRELQANLFFPETVRRHTKAIFCRTGAGRRVDLVSLVTGLKAATISRTIDVASAFADTFHVRRAPTLRLGKGSSPTPVAQPANKLTKTTGSELTIG